MSFYINTPLPNRAKMLKQLPEMLAKNGTTLQNWLVNPNRASRFLMTSKSQVMRFFANSVDIISK